MISLAQAKARIKSGARFGDVFPELLDNAAHEELRRWFCHEYEWQSKAAPPTVEMPKLSAAQAKSAGFTGNACRQCQSIMVTQNGNCEKCMTCGATSGCS